MNSTVNWNTLDKGTLFKTIAPCIPRRRVTFDSEDIQLADFNSYNERLLLQQIAEGDEMAFRKLFSVYVPFLQPTVRSIVKDAHASDDIIQETFIRIWIYRDKLPTIENPRSWVLRIAYYRAFNYMRDRQVHNKAIQSLSLNDRNSDTGTDDLIAFKTLSKLVTTAVSQLPGQQKKVYQLNREHGLSINQIATHMELSPQTVKNTLGRAMVFIRDFIEKKGYLLSLLPLGATMKFFLSK
jgi:RNA polymerase sigma-70 factor (ECF subfamily)